METTDLGFTDDFITFGEASSQEYEKTSETPELKEEEILSFDSVEEEEKTPDQVSVEETEEKEETPETTTQEEDKDKEEGEEEEETKEQEFEIDEDGLKATLLETEILTEEDFEGAKTIEEAFENKGSRIAREELEDFFKASGEEAFEAFRAIIVNGMNPEEYFQTRTQINKIENIDITKVSNQEKIVKDYYINEIGLSEEEATESIEQKKDYGLLESEARIAKNFLAKKEKEKSEREIAKLEYKKQMEKEEKIKKSQIAKNILDEALKNNSLGEFPITPEDKEKVSEFFTKNQYRNKTTGEELTGFEHFLLQLKYSNEPEVIEKALKIALLEQSNFNLKRYEKKVISKNNKNTFSNAVRRKVIDNKRKNSSGDNFILK